MLQKQNLIVCCFHWLYDVSVTRDTFVLYNIDKNIAKMSFNTQRKIYPTHTSNFFIKKQHLNNIYRRVVKYSERYYILMCLKY